MEMCSKRSSQGDSSRKLDLKRKIPTSVAPKIKKVRDTLKLKLRRMNGIAGV